MESHSSAERKPAAPFRRRRSLLQAEHSGVKRDAGIDVRDVKRDVIDGDRDAILAGHKSGEGEHHCNDCAPGGVCEAACRRFCHHQALSWGPIRVPDWTETMIAPRGEPARPD